MDILAAVITRLAMLGYTATDADTATLTYNVTKAEVSLKASTNQRVLPDGLAFTWVDMAAGMFLADLKLTGALDDVYDFSAPAQSISEGDTSVTLALASTGSCEDQFDAMLAKMIHPPESVILAFRRLAW